MRKAFFINILISVGINLLIKPFWILGIDRQVQNICATQNYGLYYALLGLSFLFGALLDMGTTSYNGRAIAQNPGFITQNLGFMLPLRLALALAYTALTMGVGWALGYPKPALIWLFLLGINQATASLTLYLRSYISGLHLFKTDSIFSVLDKFLMILLCLPLVYTFSGKQNLNITLFILVQSIGYAATALVILYFLWLKSDKIKFHFSVNKSLEILKKTLPFALMALLMGLYTKIDVVMIERLLPDGKLHASIYAASYRLLDAVNMLAVLVGGILYPMFSRMLHENKNCLPLANFSGLIVLVAAGAGAVFAYLFSTEIMNMLTPKNNLYTTSVFQVLMFTFVPMALVYVYGTLLTARANLLYINAIAAVGLVLNVGLNLIFIPKYQALGAAWVSLATQSFIVLAHFLGVFYLKNQKPTSHD